MPALAAFAAGKLKKTYDQGRRPTTKGRRPFGAVRLRKEKKRSNRGDYRGTENPDPTEGV
jgi:hypothetical protein